jgi:hypothetical protein
MTNLFAVQDFITRWERVELNERAVAQTHFNELCALIGVESPIQADPRGDFYRFEKPLTKAGGGAGFADVWRKDRFAWEYKTKGKYPDLRAAYQQLLLYKEDLDNPPILVACDIANYEVHIAFTGYRTRVERFTNADLANQSTRELLRLVFTNPEQLRPIEQVTTITELAAARFAQVAQFLERRSQAPSAIAPFFMKLLFALFAEDIHLLPAELMSQNIRQAIMRPTEFPDRVRALFRAMREGGYFGVERVPQFNGGLFDDDEVLALNADELQYLAEAARLDWSQVEPAIFGTLFERSLDPAKRAQIGAHYTSKQDILLIVEPVLMQPLRHEWDTVRGQVEALRPQWEAASGAAKQRLKGQMESVLFAFMERLSQIRVLDPACGSGNFLYVALNTLKDLEKEVLVYATGAGLAAPELGVTPAQLYGIEKNQFAAELAQVVVWIGYLQWKRTNGFWEIQEPILQTLDTIQCRDAILSVDLHGQPIEPEWPEAEVIVGNPPFLGGQKLLRELGEVYTEQLRQLYKGRVPGGADLVTYWFAHTRTLIETRQTKRAGLLATQAIRAGTSRRVLDAIKESGDIFMAWSDRPWILDGAAVRVSMVGFDAGEEQERFLDGQKVNVINSDLTGIIALTSAKGLIENQNLSFKGIDKTGPFELGEEIAQEMLSSNENPNNRPNSDVIKRWVNGNDITGKPRNMWIIDFGVGKILTEVSNYVKPFNYVEKHVKPTRMNNREQNSQLMWWQFGRPRPAMRAALVGLRRYIATPRVAKHRLFVLLDASIVPDSRLFVFARDDDYFFGVLHSHIHEAWALATSSRHGDGTEGGRPTYNNSTCFDTFPFPWPPGTEPTDDPRITTIAEAARELVQT